MFFDLDALPTGDRYKLLVSTIVPRPIAWVVSRDAAGGLNAAPYSFFNAVGDDPPMVMFSAGPRPTGTPKDTLANIQATGEFTICLVDQANLAAMVLTATDVPPGVDELAAAGLATLPSVRIGVPRIAASPVALECTLDRTVPVGRHTMVLGQVRAMHLPDDAITDVARTHIATSRLDLVGRMHGGGWYALTRELVEEKRVSAAEWAARRG